MSDFFQVLREIVRTVRAGSESTARTIRTACLIMAFASSIISVIAAAVWAIKILA
ncbi:hypothetical protein [Actinomadura gamaensis]|uniref:Phage protein n=1 Tax=Actinomadura gamaensis TaxID=1763541 RepID=A0ABV9TRB9_9ACTN